MAFMAGGGYRLELSLACADPTPTPAPEAAMDDLRAAPLQRRWDRRPRPTMGELYSELASLLPGLPYRANKADMVEAAAEHVKVLEDTVAVLEAYRAVQAGGVAGAAGEVSVSYRDTVCFAARLPPPAATRRGALTRVLEAFDRRGVEVYAATVARAGAGGDGAAMVTVTAAAAAPEVVKMIKADIAGIE
uniref:BHLH domain-containing protein n=1 Tax=Leersia perrieri TaxID=77586 RepID=A0A0D9XZZ7_9ORYZ